MEKVIGIKLVSTILSMFLAILFNFYLMHNSYRLKIKKSDIAVLFIWVILPPTFLLIFQGNFFISSILYLVLPSIYFSVRKPNVVLKALIVSLVAMPPMVIFDYLAFLNKAWAVPTIFSFRFFQFIPFEDFFFTFWAVYVVIVTSHYFFSSLKLNIINKIPITKSGIILLSLFVLFLFFYLLKPEIFIIPYYYILLVLVAFIIPALILFIQFKPYQKPLLWIVTYSICLMLPYEITANILGFWTFPSSEYIGIIRILGQSFPIEEFLAWMIFFPLATLAFGKWVTDRANY